MRISTNNFQDNCKCKQMQKKGNADADARCARDNNSISRFFLLYKEIKKNFVELRPRTSRAVDCKNVIKTTRTT